MQTHHRLLHTWQAELDRMLPELRATQRRGFGLLVAGLLWAGTVNLSRVATALPLSATIPSTERRLRRWLANAAIHPPAVWEPLRPALLGPLAGPAPVFVLDPTDLPGHQRLLVLGLALHKRVVPLAWKWAPSHRKWTKRLGTLVAQMTPTVSAALPPGVVPTLIADAGLSGPRLLQACLEAGWHFVLRLPVNHNSSHRVRLADGTECRLWSVVPGRGHTWHGAVDVVKDAGWVPVFLTISWDRHAEQPWILISDAVWGPTAVRCYRRRTHVEATFHDAKSRIWDLPMSKIVAAGRPGGWPGWSWRWCSPSGGRPGSPSAPCARGSAAASTVAATRAGGCCGWAGRCSASAAGTSLHPPPHLFIRVPPSKLSGSEPAHGRGERANRPRRGVSSERPGLKSRAQ
jgi:hypothetical protein